MTRVRATYHVYPASEWYFHDLDAPQCPCGGRINDFGALVHVEFGDRIRDLSIPIDPIIFVPRRGSA